MPLRNFESLALGWFADDQYIDKLCASSAIDHQTLRSLSLRVHNTNQDVRKLAAAFPMIEELSLPRVTREPFSFVSLTHERLVQPKLDTHLLTGRVLIGNGTTQVSQSIVPGRDMERPWHHEGRIGLETA